jgi:hypothetical protein
MIWTRARPVGVPSKLAFKTALSRLALKTSRQRALQLKCLALTASADLTSQYLVSRLQIKFIWSQNEIGRQHCTFHSSHLARQHYIVTSHAVLSFLNQTAEIPAV